MQQGKAQRHQNQEKRRIVKKGIKAREEKEKKKEEKKESMTRRGFTMSACVCAKKAIKNPPSPSDPSLQLNVAFGEAQKMRLFCPPMLEDNLSPAFVPCFESKTPPE